jgi:hypothetical protein
MSKRIKIAPEYYTDNEVDAINEIVYDILAEHYGVNVDSLEFTIEARYTVVEL